ncbi:FGLLP motif-containing membrane protein [Nocardiopsis sp. HUAS JQ3]|uniref:FGLLP motif-containing membrane protein n=1 Tax=Nocardiopsis sp. HUAS JQ3 TaxID=3061629 RepID=UPI0023A96ABF|nr:FGLLP motif-containing membrane protein [Nocardiopsis sp. HUAS JQ3]WDZ88864.1 FGLLP motif-containing membrane protein [Nocardiopsis sp. HUAS JQ3]
MTRTWGSRYRATEERPPGRSQRLTALTTLSVLFCLGTGSAAWASENDGESADLVAAPDVVFEEELGTLFDPVETVPDAQGVTGHLFGNGEDTAYLFALRDAEPCALPEGAGGTDGEGSRGVRVTVAVTEMGSQEWATVEPLRTDVYYAAPDDLVVEIVEPFREFVYGAARVRIDCLAPGGEWERAALTGLNLTSVSQSGGGAEFFVDRFSPVVEDGVVPLDLNTEEYVAGDQTTPVMEELRAELDGEPVELSGTGSTGQVLVPEGTEPGLHVLTLVREHEFTPGWVDVPVITGFAAAPAAPAPVAVQDPGLPRVDELRTDPQTLLLALGASAVAAGALMLMVGFPSDIFNKSVEANQGRVRQWWNGVRAALAGRRGRPRAVFTLRSVLAFLVFWVAAAALPVLLNWNPGPQATPLLDFLGLLVAVFFVTAFYAGIVDDRDTAWSGVRGRFEVLPTGLAIVALCSALSAALDFEPGYFYGLIAGFAAVVDRRSRLDMPVRVREDFARVREGRATMLGAVFILVLSAACYLVWSALSPAAQREDASFVLRLADKALFSTVLLGVQTVVFGLLPMKFLDGYRLWSWGAVPWAAVYLPGLFLFVYLMHMHPAQVSAQTVPESLVNTLVLFAGFGVLSLAVWLFFVWRSRRDERPAARSTRNGLPAPAPVPGPGEPPPVPVGAAAAVPDAGREQVPDLPAAPAPEPEDDPSGSRKEGRSDTSGEGSPESAREEPAEDTEGPTG